MRDRHGGGVIADGAGRVVINLADDTTAPAELRWRSRHNPLVRLAVACESCRWEEGPYLVSSRRPDRIETAEAILRALAWYHDCGKPDICLWLAADGFGKDNSRACVARGLAAPWLLVPRASRVAEGDAA